VDRTKVIFKNLTINDQGMFLEEIRKQGKINKNERKSPNSLNECKLFT
jgi:hypothetical protein